MVGASAAVFVQCGKPASAPETSTPAAEAAKPAAAADTAQPAAVAGDIVLKDLDGKNVALSSFRGKAVILNFWATWCVPCRGEIPDLLALQAEHPDTLAVVGIVVLDPISERTPAFVKDMKMTYPVLDGNDRQDLEDTYGPFVGLPTSVILDKTGAIVTRKMGAASKDDFAAAVAPLL
jgi:thiol-disulfide isomerase/thioredoxin